MFKLLDDNNEYIGSDHWQVNGPYLCFLGLLIAICLIGYFLSCEISYLWIKWFFIIWGSFELVRLIIFDIWYKKEIWDAIDRPYQLFLVFVPLSFSILNYFVISWTILKWFGEIFDNFIDLFKNRIKAIDEKTKEIKEETIRIKQEKEKLKKEKGMLSLSKENNKEGGLSLKPDNITGTY